MPPHSSPLFLSPPSAITMHVPSCLFDLSGPPLQPTRSGWPTQPGPTTRSPATRRCCAATSTLFRIISHTFLTYFSRISQEFQLRYYITPHAPCNMLYEVLVLIGCCLVPTGGCQHVLPVFRRELFPGLVKNYWDGMYVFFVFFSSFLRPFSRISQIYPPTHTHTAHLRPHTPPHTVCHDPRGAVTPCMHAWCPMLAGC